MSRLLFCVSTAFVFLQSCGAALIHVKGTADIAHVAKPVGIVSADNLSFRAQWVGPREIRLEARNDSTGMVQIAWQRAVFVDQSGKPHSVMDQKFRPIEARVGTAQLTLPPQSATSVTVVPVESDSHQLSATLTAPASPDEGEKVVRQRLLLPSFSDPSSAVPGVGDIPLASFDFSVFAGSERQRAGVLYLPVASGGRSGTASIPLEFLLEPKSKPFDVTVPVNTGAGIQGACTVTFWALGGFCWLMLGYPLPSQLETAPARAAAALMMKKPGTTVSITSSTAEGAGYQIDSAGALGR